MNHQWAKRLVVAYGRAVALNKPDQAAILAEELVGTILRLNSIKRAVQSDQVLQSLQDYTSTEHLTLARIEACETVIDKRAAELNELAK